MFIGNVILCFLSIDIGCIVLCHLHFKGGGVAYPHFFGLKSTNSDVIT